MKRKFLLSFGAISAAIILMSAIANTSHSPGAKTGSPADGANCTACHSGATQTATSWISSNIPMTGYVPGTKYTITLTGTHAGVVKFGFELTAENAQKAKIGTFTITNSTETQLTNMMHAVTHTGNGLTPSGDSKTWSFDWTAPVAGSGDVTFYASLNAADGNGGTSGDVIYNTNLTYTEDINAGIENSDQSNSFSIFPNPSTDVLNIKLNTTDAYEMSVLDLTGKQMLSEIIRSQTEVYRLDVLELPKGVYLIHLKSDRKLLTKQFVKQ
jgi:hypothetical protein